MFWPGNGPRSGRNWKNTNRTREQRISTEPIVFLDARHAKNTGVELARAVQRSLQALSSDGVLKLLTRCRPDTLTEQLAGHGLRIESHEREDKVWDIEILGADTPEIVDLRELELPEPMRQILLAATGLEGDRTYLARLPHVPHPLFPLLEERSLRWWVHEELDQSALLAVRAAR